LAIGYDSVSHESVESLFASDLEEFREGKSVSFYHGGLKHNVIAYLDLLALLQDQPERRSANYIMLGGSTYTACWGVAMDISLVASCVASCASCESKLKLGVATSNCQNCANGDLSRVSFLLHFPAPPNYPPCVLPGTGLLKPVELTYDALKSAVTVAHDGFVNSSWSSNNVNSYLCAHGINAEAIQNIMECAKNFKAIIDLPEDDTQCAALNIKQQSHPELFTMWKFPTLWCQNVNLTPHVDAIMHLIFLGVVKSTIQKILDFFALRGKQAAFLKYSNSLLEGVQHLHLCWCKCIPCKTGKFGGWVSENYLSTARMFAWLYSDVQLVAPDISDLDVTNLHPQHRLTRKENYHWLLIRGQDIHENAAQLRLHVQEMMSLPQGSPPILPPARGTVSAVLKLSSALQAMVC